MSKLLVSILITTQVGMGNTFRPMLPATDCLSPAIQVSSPLFAEGFNRAMQEKDELLKERGALLAEMDILSGLSQQLKSDMALSSTIVSEIVAGLGKDKWDILELKTKDLLVILEKASNTVNSRLGEGGDEKLSDFLKEYLSFVKINLYFPSMDARVVRRERIKAVADAKKLKQSVIGVFKRADSLHKILSSPSDPGNSGGLIKKFRSADLTSRPLIHEAI